MNWDSSRTGFCSARHPQSTLSEVVPTQPIRPDNIDKDSWQRIERKESALVMTWHIKQGVYRKKILPDVRDDPVGGYADNS